MAGRAARAIARDQQAPLFRPGVVMVTVHNPERALQLTPFASLSSVDHMGTSEHAPCLYGLRSRSSFARPKLRGVHKRTKSLSKRVQRERPLTRRTIFGATNIRHGRARPAHPSDALRASKTLCSRTLVRWMGGSRPPMTGWWVWCVLRGSLRSHLSMTIGMQ